MIEKLLQIRTQLKKKKPSFARQDSHKKAKIKRRWRSPRGIHSKMRLGIKGYRRSVSSGFRSPRLVKYLHKSGLREINVSSVKDINNIDPIKEGIIIARAVGLKKKVDVIKKALEKNIRILNVKDPQAFIKYVEDSLEQRKEEKKKQEKKREEKIKEREKKAKEKKKDELAKKVETEEEKQKREKEEKDKLLTKRV
jgi:large subunit ribosomal protein L32e